MATGFGTNAVVEAHLLYNPLASRWGGSATWHNSIPPIGGLIFGMDLSCILRA